MAPSHKLRESKQAQKICRHVEHLAFARCASQSYVSSIFDIYKTIAWKIALAISICRLCRGAPSPASKVLMCNSFHPDYDASSLYISTPCLLHQFFIQRTIDIISALVSPGFFHRIWNFPQSPCA